MASIGRNRHCDPNDECLHERSAITASYHCLREEPRRMEKSVEGGDPEKTDLDRESDPYLGGSNFGGAREPTHAEGAKNSD